MFCQPRQRENGPARAIPEKANQWYVSIELSFARKIVNKVGLPSSLLPSPNTRRLRKPPTLRRIQQASKVRRLGRHGHLGLCSWPLCGQWFGPPRQQFRGEAASQQAPLYAHPGTPFSSESSRYLVTTCGVLVALHNKADTNKNAQNKDARQFSQTTRDGNASFNRIHRCKVYLL